jgi:hypothetical protein
VGCRSPRSVCCVVGLFVESLRCDRWLEALKIIEWAWWHRANHAMHTDRRQFVVVRPGQSAAGDWHRYAVQSIGDGIIEKLLVRCGCTGNT